MNLIWYTVSGIISSVLGSVLLAPDAMRAWKSNQVLMTNEYLALKTVFVLNSAQYTFSVAYTYGWYASVFMGVSTSMQGICLSILLIVKNLPDRPNNKVDIVQRFFNGEF